MGTENRTLENRVAERNLTRFVTDPDAQIYNGKSSVINRDVKSMDECSREIRGETTKAHRDFDPEMDSYIIKSVKDAILGNLNMAPGAAMHLLKQMVDERSDVNQVFITLLKAVGDVLEAEYNAKVDSIECYQSLRAGYSDAIAYFPGVFKS